MWSLNAICGSKEILNAIVIVFIPIRTDSFDSFACVFYVQYFVNARGSLCWHHTL